MAPGAKPAEATAIPGISALALPSLQDRTLALKRLQFWQSGERAQCSQKLHWRAVAWTKTVNLYVSHVVLARPGTRAPPRRRSSMSEPGACRQPSPKRESDVRTRFRRG
jgi:hypothetical protein